MEAVNEFKYLRYIMIYWRKEKNNQHKIRTDSHLDDYRICNFLVYRRQRVLNINKCYLHSVHLCDPECQDKKHILKNDCIHLRNFLTLVRLGSYNKPREQKVYNKCIWLTQEQMWVKTVCSWLEYHKNMKRKWRNARCIVIWMSLSSTPFAVFPGNLFLCVDAWDCKTECRKRQRWTLV